MATLQFRIIETLQFFALQRMPLTLIEVHRYMLAPYVDIRKTTDAVGEFVRSGEKHASVSLHTLLDVLDQLLAEGVLIEQYGYYAVPGREADIHVRWRGSYYGSRRETMIRRYGWGLRFVPFIRGAALAGSQAFGVEKTGSDIDLLIITDPKFLWTARIWVTIYFHLAGKRRYADRIANRFCLNHYLAGEKQITRGRNLYTALEYGKLRPLVGGHHIAAFQKQNAAWIAAFFPSIFMYAYTPHEKPVRLQRWVERVLMLLGGSFTEALIKRLLIGRIERGEYVAVHDDELSFHPQSKQEGLLRAFAEMQLQQKREAEELVV